MVCFIGMGGASFCAISTYPDMLLQKKLTLLYSGQVNFSRHWPLLGCLFFSPLFTLYADI